MKEIWGGFSWVRRPVIIKYNGRKIAASMTAMRMREMTAPRVVSGHRGGAEITARAQTMTILKAMV